MHTLLSGIKFSIWKNKEFNEIWKLYFQAVFTVKHLK